MEMTNRQPIAAPPARVWNAINDPDILRRCIPGCETLEKLSDTEFTARVVLKIGPVKAAFSGKVRFENVAAPTELTLIGEGSGGIAGHARGEAHVTLAPDGDGTVLSYTVRAQIGGKIAQLGARLIQSTAQKLAGDFFAKFEQEVTALETATTEPERGSA